MHYAHTLPPPRTRDDWEPLYDHLRRVAEGDACALTGAAAFAAPFGGQEWARLLGWWHDLGKYSAAFQQYLSSVTGPGSDPDGHRAEIVGRVDHSTAGAQHAASRGEVGKLLAYCIAGHHAGLPDNHGGDSSLFARLNKVIGSFADAPADLLSLPLPAPPRLTPAADQRRGAFAIAFFTRMLFSCLVDADFLATEWFMDRDRAALRPSSAALPADLLKRLDACLEEKQRTALPTTVNQMRDSVLAACRNKAAAPPGFFSLNVPTGGGKTLSSLAFALAHANAHQLRRVVYAIPFTSIIEQTGDVFRDAMGDLAAEVLEHHSNLEPDDPRRQSERSRLAAENFDGPLVVTTNVQLFESLFGSRTSRCRKLHRLARSVIVLDEAQTLPPNLLAPTLAALSELVRNYGSTVVLCTATQPAVERSDAFPIGVDGVVPIIDDPHRLHDSLRRTQVELAGALSDIQLAELLASETQVLCIVNSRRHASDLFVLLDDPAAFHLSANMCPRHRSDTLRLIRERLNGKGPCRVVSTQVIEAGVDVDFPCVFRAVAGLDSIAQAAGRCNREGQLRDGDGRRQLGRVVVFELGESEHRPPPFVRQAIGHFREIVPDHRGDLLAPAAIEAYFRLHYWQQGGEAGRGWDEGREKKSVMECFGGVSGEPLHHQFREAADRYQLIDDVQAPVIVPYGPVGERLLAELNAMPDPPDPAWLRGFDRRAQRYVVTVHDRQLAELLTNHVLMERHGRYMLANVEAYDGRTGLRFDRTGFGIDALVL